MTEQIIDGVRIYINESGRQFLADQYDKMYKPNHGIKMISNKKHKGNNPCKKKEWYNGKKSY